MPGHQLIFMMVDRIRIQVHITFWRFHGTDRPELPPPVSDLYLRCEDLPCTRPQERSCIVKNFTGSRVETPAPGRSARSIARPGVQRRILNPYMHISQRGFSPGRKGETGDRHHRAGPDTRGGVPDRHLHRGDGKSAFRDRSSGPAILEGGW